MDLCHSSSVVRGPSSIVKLGVLGAGLYANATLLPVIKKNKDFELIGIASSGGGSGMNVTFNVQATDADSFARSETQLAAMLSRAVALGQRNL